MIRCQSCGNVSHEGTRDCPNCGRLLAGTGTPVDFPGAEVQNPGPVAPPVAPFVPEAHGVSPLFPGGPTPMMMGRPVALPPAVPPPAPRLGGSSFAMKGNFSLLFGALFGGIGVSISLFVFIPLASRLGSMSWMFLLFLLVFGGIGGMFVAIGMKTYKRRLRAWREGQAASGVITSLGLDYRVRVNGRNPFVVGYSFVWDGQSETGIEKSLDLRFGALYPGTPVTVLVVPSAPRESCLYLG